MVKRDTLNLCHVRSWLSLTKLAVIMVVPTVFSSFFFSLNINKDMQF